MRLPAAPASGRQRAVGSALRVGLLVALATDPSGLQPGKRRLETREEINEARKLAAIKSAGKEKLAAIKSTGYKGKLATLLDARVKSALEGRVMLVEQPEAYRTGLSAAEERALVECVGLVR